MELSPTEKLLVNVLYYAHKPLSTSEIAKRSHMAWQTAKKHLGILKRFGLLDNMKKGNSIYWWIKVE